MTLVCCWFDKSFSQKKITALADARATSDSPKGRVLSADATTKLYKVSETLRRVPDGHPLVTDPKSPILLGAMGTLLVLLIAGITAQVVYLRKNRQLAKAA